MIKGLVNGLGAIGALLGLAGMAEAVTDHGSFLVSLIVFAVGFSISLKNYMEGGSNRGRN